MLEVLQLLVDPAEQEIQVLTILNFGAALLFSGLIESHARVGRELATCGGVGTHLAAEWGRVRAELVRLPGPTDRDAPSHRIAISTGRALASDRPFPRPDAMTAVDGRQAPPSSLLNCVVPRGQQACLTG